MNISQALKAETEICKVCEKYQGIWVTVSKDMHPELKMIRLEISIKVDDDPK